MAIHATRTIQLTRTTNPTIGTPITQCGAHQGIVSMALGTFQEQKGNECGSQFKANAAAPAACGLSCRIPGKSDGARRSTAQISLRGRIFLPENAQGSAILQAGL